MYVVKRDGRKEPVHFDKITNRIRKLAWKLAPSVDPVQVAKKVMLHLLVALVLSCIVLFFLFFCRICRN